MIGSAGCTLTVCGRYTVRDPAGIPGRFIIGFNVAASQQVPVVIKGAAGRALQPMHRGFRPPRMQAVGRCRPPISARAEILLERLMFRCA